MMTEWWAMVDEVRPKYQSESYFLFKNKYFHGTPKYH